MDIVDIEDIVDIVDIVALPETAIGFWFDKGWRPKCFDS